MLRRLTGAKDVGPRFGFGEHGRAGVTMDTIDDDAHHNTAIRVAADARVGDITVQGDVAGRDIIKNHRGAGVRRQRSERQPVPGPGELHV
jgi:hypothetical protein